MPIFRHRLTAGLANRGDGCLGLLQMALLDAELLLLFDQELKYLEIAQLRAQFLLHQRLADIDARLDHRNDRLELVDRRRRRRLLGFLLRLLTQQGGDLGAVLRHLVEQELALRGDQFGVRAGGSNEISCGIIAAGKCRAQARDIEPFGQQVVAQMIAFGLIGGRIELDQDVACLDRLTVLHFDRTHHAGLERLDRP